MSLVLRAEQPGQEEVSHRNEHSAWNTRLDLAARRRMGDEILVTPGDLKQRLESERGEKIHGGAVGMVWGI